MRIIAQTMHAKKIWPGALWECDKVDVGSEKVSGNASRSPD